ncbi:hypothetical protein [Streptosporangium pseudovulgare]|uniref:DUF1877 domain-containing protein n=1 Tax=Streptosporangium pseudovulgare TaxID=35765 RepID=A0ABQ2QYH2_9ACTN|nr:hypothetical protein [Streptosporangium pseudovulgare]GGQ04329.1 hypothetical protein GCM10010140_38040 [Streptosporangium pseudovulgare]
MGVFYEYYRAADRTAATVQSEHSREIADPSRGVPEFDVVVAKWIDPEVVLGQLVAFAGHVDYRLGLAETVVLYPPPEGAPRSDEEWDALPEDSPYLEGLGIMELSAKARDMLAGVDDARLPMLAEQWAAIEEFSHFTDDDDGYMLSLTKDLVGLARRARENDQLLYCWFSL